MKSLELKLAKILKLVILMNYLNYILIKAFSSTFVKYQINVNVLGLMKIS